MFAEKADPLKEGFSPYVKDYDLFGDIWSLWQPTEEADEAAETASWFSWFIDAPIETGADLAIREQESNHDVALNTWDAWFGDAFASEVEIEWGTPVANTIFEYDAQPRGLIRYPELEAGLDFGFDQGGMDAAGYGEAGGSE